MDAILNGQEFVHKKVAHNTHFDPRGSAGLTLRGRYMSKTLPEISDTGSDAGNKTRLSPQAKKLLQDRTHGLPVWIRSPKIGVETYSGFSRAKLYELAGKNAIRSVSIREPGQVKGTRLFNLASILAFIEKCEQAAVKEAPAREGAVQS